MDEELNAFAACVVALIGLYYFWKHFWSEPNSDYVRPDYIRYDRQTRAIGRVEPSHFRPRVEYRPIDSPVKYFQQPVDSLNSYNAPSYITVHRLTKTNHSVSYMPESRRPKIPSLSLQSEHINYSNEDRSAGIYKPSSESMSHGEPMQFSRQPLDSQDLHDPSFPSYKTINRSVKMCIGFSKHCDDNWCICPTVNMFAPPQDSNAVSSSSYKPINPSVKMNVNMSFNTEPSRSVFASSSLHDQQTSYSETKVVKATGMEQCNRTLESARISDGQTKFIQTGPFLQSCAPLKCDNASPEGNNYKRESLQAKKKADNAHTNVPEDLFKQYESPVGKKKVAVVESLEDCVNATNFLKDKCAGSGILGFDCEWKSFGRRSPVALLQLATINGYCLLVRLCALKKVPSEVWDLLVDKSILKVGMDPFGDAVYLNEDYNLRVGACADLQDLALLVGGPPKGGLKALAEKFLNVTMDKRTALSNWERNELSEEQINYAADDALVGVQIFDKLCQLCTAIKIFSRDFTNCDMTIVEEFIGISCVAGTKAVYKMKKKKSTLKAESKTICIDTLSFYKKHYFLSPKGDFFCLLEGGVWLLLENKAEIVSVSPCVLRLFAEPSSCCTRCGEQKAELCVWKEIVPPQYRLLYPAKLEKQLPERRAWLCYKCNASLLLLETDWMIKLAKECDAPLDKEMKFLIDRENACRKVLNCPSGELEAAFKQLDCFLRRPEVYRQGFRKIMRLPRKSDDTHYGRVVQYYRKKGTNGLEVFESEWMDLFKKLELKFPFVFLQCKDLGTSESWRQNVKRRLKRKSHQPAF